MVPPASRNTIFGSFGSQMMRFTVSSASFLSGCRENVAPALNEIHMPSFVPANITFGLPGSNATESPTITLPFQRG